MKTIGLIGGMSWESTQSYYRLLNLGVKEHLGGLHSALRLFCTLLTLRLLKRCSEMESGMKQGRF